MAEKYKENKEGTIPEKLQGWPSIIMLFITFGNILAGVFNLGVASKLEPVASDLRLIENRVSVMEIEIDDGINGGEFGIFAEAITKPASIE